MIEEFVFAPVALFFGLFGMLIAVAGIIVTVYALYDVIFRQPQMESLEKLLWVLVIIFFNIVGVVVYLLVVRMWDTRVLDEVDLGEDRKLRELERLTDLKERGTLTEEEFEQEKQHILGENGKD